MFSKTHKERFTQTLICIPTHTHTLTPTETFRYLLTNERTNTHTLRKRDTHTHTHTHRHSHTHTKKLRERFPRARCLSPLLRSGCLCLFVECWALVTCHLSSFYISYPLPLKQKNVTFIMLTLRLRGGKGWHPTLASYTRIASSGLRELSLVGLGVRESLYEWCFSWIRFGRNGDP